MSELVNITPAAIKKLKQIGNEEGKELRIRLAMLGGGCSGYQTDMSFTEWPKDEDFDLTFTIDEVEFLVDLKSASLLAGATLDYRGGLLDKGFKWEFPSATSSCGCGTSFSF